VAEAAALDRIGISVKAHRLLEQLLGENPHLEEIMRHSKNEVEALVGVRKWVLGEIEGRPAALKLYESDHPSRDDVEALGWADIAAIRLLDYVDNAGREFEDLNLRGEPAVSNPVNDIWLAVNHGTGGAKPYFFEDMIHLFRQFSGRSRRRLPSRERVQEWMDRHPSGLDPRIVHLRRENRERILRILIRKLDSGEIRNPRYRFESGLSEDEKFARALEWWDEPQFHLGFAVRSPELLNEFLGHSLDPDTMRLSLARPGARASPSSSISITCRSFTCGCPTSPSGRTWRSVTTCSTPGSSWIPSGISWPGRRRTKSSPANPMRRGGCCRRTSSSTGAIRRSPS